MAPYMLLHARIPAVIGTKAGVFIIAGCPFA